MACHVPCEEDRPDYAQPEDQVENCLGGSAHGEPVLSIARTKLTKHARPCRGMTFDAPRARSVCYYKPAPPGMQHSCVTEAQLHRTTRNDSLIVRQDLTDPSERGSTCPGITAGRRWSDPHARLSARSWSRYGSLRPQGWNYTWCLIWDIRAFTFTSGARPPKTPNSSSPLSERFMQSPFADRPDRTAQRTLLRQRGLIGNHRPLCYSHRLVAATRPWLVGYESMAESRSRIGSLAGRAMPQASWLLFVVAQQRRQIVEERRHDLHGVRRAGDRAEEACGDHGKEAC